jgi:hypothetical protein
MPGKQRHREVAPTKRNCEKDFRDKLKLNAEFAEFKKLFEKSAKSSPDLEKLVIPLRRLEKAMNIAAHGMHFVLSHKTERS